MVRSPSKAVISPFMLRMMFDAQWRNVLYISAANHSAFPSTSAVDSARSAYRTTASANLTASLPSPRSSASGTTVPSRVDQRGLKMFRTSVPRSSFNPIDETVPPSADAVRRDCFAQLSAYGTERRREVAALLQDVGHLCNAEQIRRNLHIGIVLANQEHPPSVEYAHEEAKLEDHIVTRSQFLFLAADDCVVWRNDEGGKIRAAGNLREGIKGNAAGPEHSVLPDNRVEFVVLETGLQFVRD